MRKIFIAVLIVIFFIFGLFYEFSLAKNNVIEDFVCKSSAGSGCQVDAMCGTCQEAETQNNNGYGCLMIINRYFGYAGHCAKNEAAECVWSETWRTGVCVRLGAFSAGLKARLGIR